MEIMKDKDMNPGTPEDRITALERKMKDMDALVKGLTEELLDLKSIAMRLNKVSEERRQELKTVKPALGGTPSGTVVMQKKGTVSTTTPRAPEPPKEEPMEMIMQPDGTLKPEKRIAGGEYVVASAGYSKKKGSVGDTKRKDNLIVAEDEEKSSSAKKE